MLKKRYSNFYLKTENTPYDEKVDYKDLHDGNYSSISAKMLSVINFIPISMKFGSRGYSLNLNHANRADYCKT